MDHSDPSALKYRAFLSYSHVDTSWAKWLHRSLERFHLHKTLAGRRTARGPVPSTLYPIFRDREEFRSGDGLADATIAALDQSATLIVLCSPFSAKSHYVNEEVRLFRSRHPSRPVIPVIVRGVPPEIFPAALRYELSADGTVSNDPVTVLAADVRVEGDGKSLALAKVIAGVTGLGTEEIARRAAQDRRQALRNRVIGLSSVGCVLAGLVVWAEVQQRAAETSERRASDQSDNALIKQSGLLASLSLQATNSGDAATGMMLALEGLPLSGQSRPYVAEAHASLARALFENRNKATLPGSVARYSPDGKRILTLTQRHESPGVARLWDPTTGGEVARLARDEHLVGGDFTSDGVLLAFHAEDGTIGIWDLLSGNKTAALKGLESDVWSVIFSHDNKRIITTSHDPDPDNPYLLARLWNRATASTIPLSNSANGAIFSADGNRIATYSTARGIQIWNANSGAQLRALKGPINAPEPISSPAMAFSSNGDRIAAAMTNGNVIIWDASTGEEKASVRGSLPIGLSPDGGRIVVVESERTAVIYTEAGVQLAVLQGHEKKMTDASFSPDGSKVVTASDDGTARIWDAWTGAQLALLKVRNPEKGHPWAQTLFTAAFSPDGTHVLTTAVDGSRVWANGITPEVAALRGHTGPVTKAVLSPDGASVATAGQDHTARIWDARTGMLRLILAGHDAPVEDVAFSPDGRRVVTASWDGTAKIWDVVSGANLRTLPHREAVTQAIVSADGKLLVTVSRDGIGHIWELESGKERFRHAAQRAAISRDSKRVVTVRDGIGRIWDVTDGDLLAQLDGELNSFADPVFSPDGTRVLGAILEKATIWDSLTGKAVRSFAHIFPPLRSVAYSPDGMRIVTAGDDRTARVWDAATGEAIAVLQHDNLVQSAQFSPDASLIVTASADRTVRLWDVKSGIQLAEYSFHEGMGGTTGIDISADGTRIVSASRDDYTIPNGIAHVWRVYSAQELIDEAQRAVPGCLTLPQRQAASLPRQPPLWCIELRKPPYDSEAWRAWLAAKKAGQDRPLPPPTPEELRALSLAE
jgi:WD40 repeat protein